MPTVPADATWLALAAAAGSCIALQAAANAALKHQLGDARYAAFFSICGTILSAVFFMLIMRPAPPTAAAIRTAPWWNWIGGPLGAMIVLAGATLTPKLGAAAFIAAVVGGQLVCSLALDHFGMMNLPQQGLSASRLLGAAMVFAGVLLVRYG
jgi:transporter family-2 protein